MTAAVPSPCTSVCTLGRDDICTGCGRSLPEIAEWRAATPARQRAIALTAALRLAATHPERA